MPTPLQPNQITHPVARPWLRSMARPAFVALACATGIFATTRASARDHASRNLGSWTVAASKDGKGCFLTKEYDRETTLLLGLDIDGSNRLSILNPNWSIESKSRMKLNIRLSNSSYPAHFAVGIVSDGKQGFVTSFGAKFPTYFAASEALDISRGDVQVTKLALDGSGAAVAALRDCVADRREKPPAGASHKEHIDDIPVDPFAPAPARRSNR